METQRFGFQVNFWKVQLNFRAEKCLDKNDYRFSFRQYFSGKINNLYHFNFEMDQFSRWNNDWTRYCMLKSKFVEVIPKCLFFP